MTKIITAILVLFLSFLFPLETRAENSKDVFKDAKSDSLIALVKSSKGEIKIHQLESLVSYLHQQGQVKYSLIFIDQALSLSRRLKYNKGEAQALLNKGTANYINGDIENAERYFLDATKLANSGKMEAIKGNLHVQLGFIESEKGNYSKALSHYFLAERILQNEKAYLNLIRTCFNISEIYSNLREYSKAIKYQRKGLNLLLKYRNNRQDYLCIGISSLGILLIETGSIDSGMHLLNEGMNLASSIDQPLLKIEGYSKLGHAYQKLGDLNLALKYYDSAISTSILKDVNCYNKNAIHIKRARIQYVSGRNTSEVISNLKTLLVIYDTMNILPSKVFVLKTIAEILELEGNSRQSLLYYKQYQQAFDSITSPLKLMNIGRIEEFYNLESLKDERNKQQKLAQESRQKNAVLLVFILLGIISNALIITHFIKKSKRQKELYNKALSIAEKLQEDGKTIPEIHQNEPLVTSEENNEPSYKDRLPESKHELLASLQKAVEDKVYLDPKCDKSYLAYQVGTNSNYLSKIIQWHYGMSFSDFLHNLRLKEVLYRLQNERKFRNYSVESISKEVGYTGKRTFEMAFKKKLGISPAYYIRRLTASINEKIQDND